MMTSTAAVRVREVGLELPEALAREAAMPVLVEGLDYWLFACVAAGREAERREAFLAALAGARTHVTVISCEVGLGPVAADAATRAFVRGLGSLNRAAAALADEVVLVVAGRPLILPADKAAAR